ncbi:MAG TPA: CDP-diacylglycerol--glycerol-3-phosphate 3-phosphatidyltransferase [Planctomycetota bacterium]|nr:CDP-diacylglycerol--glycerol-3-phosphate 3-phosphatidyltransferase [Planctomycetota bacterium]
MLLMTAANKVTSIRFLLCIAYYILLTLCARKHDVGMLTVAFILNQIIAWSDLLDGYLARKYKEVTHFGRIADPLVDKILVCGSFIFFLTLDPLNRIFTAWFATVVLGREFLVSGIRGAMEAAGFPFPATFWGKAKTAIQNVTVGTGLGYATWFPTTRWTEVLTIVCMWATLVATGMSGITYVASARKFLGSERV